MPFYLLSSSLKTYMWYLYADDSLLKHKIWSNCFKLLLFLSVNTLLFCFSVSAVQFSCSLGTITIVYAKYIHAYICGWLQVRYIECGVKQGFY